MKVTTEHEGSGDSLVRIYCNRIVNEVNCVETLLSGSIAYVETSDNDDTTELREIWNVLAADAGEKPEKYSPKFMDYCNSYAMDFVTLGERNSSIPRWHVTGGRLVITSGGPEAWISWEVGSTTIRVNVLWASARSSVSMSAPFISDGFAQETSQ